MARPLFLTSDDMRKILNFWFDQRKKYYYFETATLKVASHSERQRTERSGYVLPASTDYREEVVDYFQDRIIGRISDVVPYPPSLLLHDTSIFTVRLEINYGTQKIENHEKRPSYGLVFSQITYYEPVENIEEFFRDDSRIINTRGNFR
jgi:hypothetical protein